MIRAVGRHVQDREFDSIYPPSIREVSPRYWTPVDVARRAARMLRRAGARRVLDVGCGVGKFVLVAADAAPEICFVGVEQRARLVEIANRARERLALQNALFVTADATMSSWRSFDAFYFFNPFAESLFTDGEQLDDDVELSKTRFYREVVRTERALREARLGTVVVTYHGMSGRMPACYELSENVRAGTDWLRAWVKTREIAEGFYLESGDEVILHRADGALA